jgi:hypothetical protein
MALFDEALTKRLTDLSTLFASLVSGKVPASQLPSYVDDVLEYANFAALPGTGESGKIYVTLDNNKTFRWSGSSYIEISASPGSSDSVTEGSTNLYFTNARALAAAPAETATTEGVLINGATAKTTPVDADMFGVMDSAASNVLKKLSWSNIKATLKAYFDTLYPGFSQGTYLTVLSFGGASVGVVYSSQTASFQVVGNRVTVSGYLTLTSKGSSSGQASISLPFPVVNYSSASIFVQGFSGLSGAPLILALDGTSLANLYYTGVGSTAGMGNWNMSDTSEIIFSITYQK